MTVLKHFLISHVTVSVHVGDSQHGSGTKRNKLSHDCMSYSTLNAWWDRKLFAE